MSFKKILSHLLLPLFVLVPITISAQVTTSADTLMAQISELLAQVEALQAQLSTQVSQDTSFYRNLKVGDRGPDVKSLQELLNSNSKTKIASFGPGSAGEETTYFGNLTADAVSKFQELYMEDVLIPAGLTFGTGYFGPSTIKKANDLIKIGLEKEVVAEGTEAVVQEEEIVETEDEPYEVVELPDLFDGISVSKDTEFFISNYSDNFIRPGDTLEVIGTGFSKSNNTITFGDVVLENINTTNPSLLKFEVPDVSPGVYIVSVSNGFRESHETDIVVSVESPTGVVIENVTPEAISPRSIMTIYGTGFMQSGNVVFVDGFYVRDLKSLDGETISFAFVRPSFNKNNVPQFVLDVLGPELFARLEATDFNASFDPIREMPVRVINANGESGTFMSKYKSK